MQPREGKTSSTNGSDVSGVWCAARAYVADAALLLLPHQLLVTRGGAARLGLNALAMVRVSAPAKTDTDAVVLECVVDQWREAASGSECVVHLSAWTLEVLGLRDGSTVDVQRAAPATSADTAATCQTIELSVLRKHPTALSASMSSAQSPDATAAALHCLPESVREGKIDLAQALARQLRSSGHLAAAAAHSALAPGDLLAARLLHETFVFRVEHIRTVPAPVGTDEHDDCCVRVCGWTAPAGAPSHYESTTTTASATASTLAERLESAGFTGYDTLVRDVLLSIALVVKGTPVLPGTNTAAATSVQTIGSHGVLLAGVHGTGKTLACRVLEREVVQSGVAAARIDATALLMDAESSRLATVYDFLLQRVQDALPTCALMSPMPQGTGVLFIDDVDVLFESSSGAAAADDAPNALPPLGSALLRLLDMLSDAAARVCIVGTTTSADVRIPTVAKRASRFSKTLELIVPTEAMRSAILTRHLRALPLATEAAADGDDTHVRTIASRLAALTGGYVAKDLVRICRHALVQAHRAVATTTATTIDQAGGTATAAAVTVTWRDLLAAQQRVKPSQLRELNVASPGAAANASSDALAFAGYAALQRQLVDFIAWKFSPTAAMNRLGVANASGILVHGPSGCGKSLLVRTLAAQARVNVVSVKSSEVMSKYFGDSEKAVRELFARARAAAPCILFFDEFDAIAHKRSFNSDSSGGGSSDSVYARILSTFLNEMDGVGAAASSSSGGATSAAAQPRGEILVIAATNRLDALDAALIRPGRIDKTIELGLPNVDDKEAIFAHCTRKMPLAPDVDLASLARRATGDHAFTGADVAAVCKDAAFRALRDYMDAAVVAMRHFDAAWRHRIGNGALDRTSKLS